MIIKKPNEIIDFPALSAALNAAEASRPQRAALLHAALKQGQEVIHDRLHHAKSVSAALSYLPEYSFLIDQLITAIWQEEIAQHPALGLEAAIIAVGGYGRAALFPHSDIDLLIITQQTDMTDAEAAIQSMLYYLWDLGLTVGHATRTIRQSIKQANQDHTIAAAMLDARFICGNQPLSERLFKQFNQKVRGANAAQFIEAKLAEQGLRHHRHGDSRFILEPNLKENKGGLRDLHTLHWLCSYCFGASSVGALVERGLLSAEEGRRFVKADQFLSLLRLHLHLMAGRAEERLTFDHQLQLAGLLGYRAAEREKPVERFMKRYYQSTRHVGNLTGLICALLEAQYKRPGSMLTRLMLGERQIGEFTLDHGRLVIPETINLAARPLIMLECFALAQANHLEIHPRSLQSITRHLHHIAALRQDPAANQLFMIMLTAAPNPQQCLMRLNEAGMLARFIPEFAHTIGQMQYDRYHVYTVDEHIIRAIGILHQLIQGELKQELPLASQVIRHISQHSILYLALFCHDIAKGKGGGHAAQGEKIALKLSARFGLTSREADDVAWLVREHLLFTETAFKRDVSDAATIRDFIVQVQSPERLRLLLIVAVCDIRAVGPTIWNGWKGSLLRELYHRSEEAMGAAPAGERSNRLSDVHDELAAALKGWSDEERSRYRAAGTPAFWLGQPLTDHVRMARIMRALWQGHSPLTYDYHCDQFAALTTLYLALPLRPGLLHQIAGCVAMQGASIAAARIFTLKDGTAACFIGIQTQTGEAFTKTPALERFPSQLMQLFSGALPLAQSVASSLPRHYGTGSIRVEPHVVLDNHSSAEHTVIEVNGQDRSGFLFELTGALEALQLHIATAHISTYGEKAVDVFYVKDNFGLKIEHPARIETIRQHLLEHLQGPAPTQLSA